MEAEEDWPISSGESAQLLSLDIGDKVQAELKLDFLGTDAEPSSLGFDGNETYIVALRKRADSFLDTEFWREYWPLHWRRPSECAYGKPAKSG